jgi:uridine kinase
LAELVVSRREACPLRVAIDGPDAAGKTTLADAVAALVAASGRPVIRASIDGFHRPRAERHRRGRASPEGYYLDSLDHEALRNELLERLGPDGDRRYRTAVFDVRNDSPRADEPLLATSDAVLLFDGVFLLRPDLNPSGTSASSSTFELEEALRRGCERDAGLFGSAVAASRYRWRYLPGQRLYLQAVKPWQLAAAVLDNTDPASPRLRPLSPYAPRLDAEATSG